jgi:hypothetical protein
MSIPALGVPGPRSGVVRIGCRALEPFQLLQLFADDVSVRGEDVAPKAMANHLVDAFRDARLAVHESVEIVGVEHSGMAALIDLVGRK